jgi:cyclopropane-fatty-acyl-phospholipid synthase
MSSEGEIVGHGEGRAASLSPGMAMLLGIAARLDLGELTVTLPDGRSRHFVGAQPGPRASLRIRHPRMARRVLFGGSVGFAESYIDGDWDTPDLAGLLELLDRNHAALGQSYYGRWLARLRDRVAHVLRPNSRAGSRRNIRAHYDLGNAFFAAWLDPTLTYSAARFTAPEHDLEQAQLEKYRSLARLIGLTPGHRLLEIGSGWGSFAVLAAREFGARVRSITVSREQHDYAARRVHELGLADRVAIELRDYRDVDGRYDRIASIEMFEAVGERWWPVFFDRLRAALAPGGLAGLQIITIADQHFPAYRKGADFIQRYIFPGGMLPSPSALAEHIGRAGLVLQDQVAFGACYARTLSIWHARFTEAWERIAALGFDERFRRLWSYYLAYCEAGFRTGSTDVVQLAVAQR